MGDPTGEAEEAPGPPAESEHLERKSTEVDLNTSRNSDGNFITISPLSLLLLRGEKDGQLYTRDE